MTTTTDTTMLTETTPVFPTFASLSELNPLLQKALQKMELVTMTEIQAESWAAVSAGRDMLGRARTGTGKTVAFLLPSLQKLLLQQQPLPTSSSKNQHSSNRVQMLVLSPTRELAMQIAEQAKQLTQFAQASISVQVVFGGASKPQDIKRFEKQAPTILVATPGRMKDHLQTTRVRGVSFAQLLSATQILVLDETDRLLDMGFKRDVDEILSYLPKQRQTLLFSATVPQEVKQVINATLRPNFSLVDCIHDKDPNSQTNQQVEQSHVILPSDTRLVSGTVDILLHYIHVENNDLKMVVFFPTTNLVAFYSALFEDLGVEVWELHSRKSQSYRTKASNAFREADRGILFTSDVSARGVDYPGVTHVVQFGIPDSKESYIHRLGRTGRAGKVGEGLLVLTDLEAPFLSTLRGLDVPVNATVQELVQNESLNQAKLAPILSSVGSGKNKDLVKNIEQAYRSMLGFYNGKLKGNRTTERMIEFANGFAKQAGLTELPELELKTARKMGLQTASGLNLVKQASNTGTRGGGGRGGVSQGRGSGGGSGSGRGGGASRLPANTEGRNTNGVGRAGPGRGESGRTSGGGRGGASRQPSRAMTTDAPNDVHKRHKPSTGRGGSPPKRVKQEEGVEGGAPKPRSNRRRGNSGRGSNTEKSTA